MVRGGWVLVVLGVLLASPLLGADPATRAEQRQHFADAYAALRDGRLVDLDAVDAALSDYPLRPYLRYWELMRRLPRVSSAEVEAFIDAHGDLPVAAQLARHHLSILGRLGRWEEFKAFDRGQSGASIACYRLQAERHLHGVDEPWLDRARALWTVAHSQPEACDPVFDELYRRQALSAERRWERMTLIIQADNRDLARALARRLEPHEQRWLERWLALAANPERALRQPAFEPRSERGRQLILDGFQRLAREDVDRAQRLLAEYQQRDWLSDDDLHALRRTLALRAAYARHPQALEWLRALPSEMVDDTVREWTARVAVGRQDWPALREAVEELTPDQRNQAQWRYWRAVALERTGEPEAARRLFQELSGERHYYGFLAADVLDRPYVMNHRAAPRDEQRLEALAARAPLRRAREFHALGMYDYARREWLAGLAGADAADWAQAAQLARDWGWYDRMIDAANRAGLHDALELRFPLAYRELLAEQGRSDLASLYAVIRKESAFASDARSPAGALGLMQVTPATARRVAARSGLVGVGSGDLLQPEVNLRLGAAYLEEMLERFGGNLILAAAAYNAGPGRAEVWQRRNAGQPADVWIENITFAETRDYVKSVLAFRAVFEWQLYGEPRRLASVMPVMPGKDGLHLALREETSAER